MQLKKVVIGVSFTRKSFKLSSLGGILIDEILALRETNRKLDNEFLTRFSSSNDTSNLHLKFIDDKGINSLIIQPDSFTFYKSAANEKAVVNIDKVIDEFSILWKVATKVLDYKDIRRVGLVGEFHIEPENEHSASNELVQALTRIDKPDFSGRFHLQYEDRDLQTTASLSDLSTADYWNTIYTYTPTDLTLHGVEGKICSTLDVQKYYNPAKSDPIRELKLIKSKFDSKKADLKKRNRQLGLCS